MPVSARKITHSEVNSRRINNGLESTKVGISNQASEKREHSGDADPDVDILGGGGGGLAEDIGEVSDEVSGDAVVSKPLRHFNNYSTHGARNKPLKQPRKIKQTNQ